MSEVETSPVATRKLEAWFEYAASRKEAETTGLRRIDDPDDPRWDGELMQKPFNGTVQGYTNVAWVTRVDGVEARDMRKGVCGYGFHKNKAQEFIRNFVELQKAGSKTPWDQERHFRDQIELAETMRKEGRMDEMRELGRILKEALQPVNRASGGSPVKNASDSLQVNS